MPYIAVMLVDRSGSFALAVSLLADPLPSWSGVGHAVESIVPALIWAVVILALTYGISRVASGRFRGALSHAGLQPSIALLLGRVVWGALWIIGVLLALDQFTNGLTPLAAVIGVFGLAASLALQTVLQNLVAGIYLLIERPFNLDDYIAVIGPGGANHEGRVQDIQMRTTHLRNRDDELILIPNFSIFSGVVTNRTAEGGLVQHLTVTLPREADVSAVREQMMPLLLGLTSVLDTPAPILRVDQVDKDTWSGALSLWVRSQEGASGAVWAIARAFPAASITRGTPTA